MLRLESGMDTTVTGGSVSATELHRPTIEAIVERLRLPINPAAIASVERFDYDGDGACFLVVGVDGERMAFFDAWRPSSKVRIRVSGFLREHPEHGRMVGIASRNRLHYSETPRDSSDWVNVPGDRFAAMQDMARKVVDA